MRDLKEILSGSFTTCLLLAGSQVVGGQVAPLAPAAASSDTIPLSATASFGTDWVPSDSAIVLTLSRPLADADGRVGILIGATDVTALFQRIGIGLRYNARAMRLPSGQSELAVY